MNAAIVADTSAIPSLSDAGADGLHLAWDVTLTTEQPRSAIDDVFIFVMDDMELDVQDIDGGTVAAAPMKPLACRQAITLLRRSHRRRRCRGAPVKPASRRLRRQYPSPTSVKPKLRRASAFPAERLDELMDRVGELVIAQSRLSQLASASADIGLRSVSEEIERLSGELRDTMMVLRMVPVASLFGRFRRLVHDLARETGKVIELVTEGETTEVDKTVIERLADPLVHLVRNAIDHGLETPEERLAAGKAEAGKVTLSARQAGRRGDHHHHGRRPRHRPRAGPRQGGILRADRSRAQQLTRPGAAAADLRARLFDRGAESPTCPAAASAWTWSSARSRRCAAPSTSSARRARARRSRCASR